MQYWTSPRLFESAMGANVKTVQPALPPLQNQGHSNLSLTAPWITCVCMHLEFKPFDFQYLRTRHSAQAGINYDYSSLPMMNILFLSFNSQFLCPSFLFAFLLQNWIGLQCHKCDRCDGIRDGLFLPPPPFVPLLCIPLLWLVTASTSGTSQLMV